MGSSNSWRWSEDVSCYIMTPAFVDTPVAFCLGDRYVHWVDGVNTHKILLMGSTTGDWHGYEFGYDLKSAIKWLQQAYHKERGCELWKDL